MVVTLTGPMDAFSDTARPTARLILSNLASTTVPEPVTQSQAWNSRLNASVTMLSITAAYLLPIKEIVTWLVVATQLRYVAQEIG
jgi:hypothetical protein